MKKITALLASLLLVLGMTSCEKDDIENTATVSLAGDWYVTVDAVDDAGNVVIPDADLFGKGRIHMLTYNTAANVGTQLYVEDEGNFWNFKVKTTSDPSKLTFATTTTENNNEGGDPINVTITDGKILPQMGHQNNGSVADSISFYVTFSDDKYPAKYGYAKYHVSGVRYSGLAEND